MALVNHEPAELSGLLTESVGEAIVRALAAHGVTHVFGIPGTHNLELYRGLRGGAEGSGIHHVTPRHEQGAGYAADAYARSTGRPGVVITTSGPGLLNALAALGTAYADSIPVLVLSPGPATGLERADIGWLHEVKDQRAAVDAVVARSVRCHSAEQAVAEIARTFAEWSVSRPRPVHLEIPIDVLESRTIAVAAEASVLPGIVSADTDAVARAAAVLRAAERPLVLAGGGAVDAGVGLAALAELLGAPVVTTTTGKAALAETHPLSGGVAVPYAAEALAEADVVLVVGSELAETDVDPDVFSELSAVVRVDISVAQLAKPVAPTVALLGHADRVLAQLVEALAVAGPADAVAHPDALDRAARIRDLVRGSASSWVPLHDALAAALAPDTIVCGDSSQVSYRGTAPLLLQGAARSFLYPNGFATLGYAVPAAVGASLGNPGRPVLALLGDGAFLFSVQELVTAVEQGLGFTVVVLDNGGYGEIRDQMVSRDIPSLGVDLHVPDLALLARALGCEAREAGSIASLVEAVADSLVHPGTVPTVIVARQSAVL
ncbi:thiamine pyrophosphate-binding protein [Herbiconiux moechotypicola]|uniref:5-guanidino-2-oxopentanoate decarboxylase n=1 Tax=Herbiconiux moechotypicola TaxID=637393 RepID=A0ABP5Q7W6_9MICO|nr:thiamine pyrophosphate-binding protein [Herbiconiux moechotypicola]MCS5729138.1 thiamine pyrophosphate-binding protein [Herbiconiux moechotypicola]